MTDINRQTAGELSLKAASDKTKYDPMEVAYAFADGLIEEVFNCAHRHKTIFDEPEYFVTLNIASDPLIKGIRRHKYAAFLYLPSPRPEQSCFLYNKHTDQLKRLWSLPKAETMALLSEQTFVAKPWQKTKAWVDAFYRLQFWEYIRKEHNINHLSESEYIKLHKQELINAGAKDSPTRVPEPFDFSKIKIDHIVDTQTAHSQKDVLDNAGKTK